MKKHRGIVAALAVILILSAAACSVHPGINIGKVLGMTENFFSQSENMVTAGAYDGKQLVKFRLMAEGQPSEADAQALFEKVMDCFGRYSGRTDFWNYYNGHFEIASYDKNDKNSVVYNAEKSIGKALVITPA